MKKYLLASLIITASAYPSYAEWYEGGTLHQASASQWQAASPANRLATASDWSVKILGSDTIRSLGFSGWKSKAKQLSDCVTQSTSGTNIAANEAAAACVIIMKW